MWWLVAAWLTVARAEPLPPEIAGLTKAVDLANAGNPTAALRELDAIVARWPDLADARVLRGLCKYTLGDEEGAHEDLAWAFSEERWSWTTERIEKGQEVMREVSTLDLTEHRAVGAARLVVMDARDGDTKEARATLKRGRDAFGDDPRLAAAEARLLFAEGDKPAGWAKLAVARAGGDVTGFVDGVASELVALDTAGAPTTLVTSLVEEGQWTAAYNDAASLLSRGQAAQCVAVMEAAIAKFPEPKLRTLGYQCAARSDATAAYTWLERLGGAKQAPAADVLSHGRTLVAGGRAEEAVALLAALPKSATPTVARDARTVELEALVALGRLDDALKRSDGSAPVAQVRVAHALVTAKRVPDAQKLLEKTCPALAGDPAKDSCDQLLSWAQGQQ